MQIVAQPNYCIPRFLVLLRSRGPKSSCRSEVLHFDVVSHSVVIANFKCSRNTFSQGTTTYTESSSPSPSSFLVLLSRSTWPYGTLTSGVAGAYVVLFQASYTNLCPTTALRFLLSFSVRLDQAENSKKTILLDWVFLSKPFLLRPLPAICLKWKA